MATSTAEFRNLVINYKAITAASRTAGNADPDLLGQLRGLLTALEPYVAEGFSAGGYDDADTISKDVSSYINTIESNIANGKKPVVPIYKEADLNKQVVIAEVPPAGADGDQGSDGDSSSTIAGKAGSSKAADAAPKVGLRDYNPLGEFSSYTYRVALYMMNSAQFNDYMAGDYSTLKDFLLIAQSGGITAGVDSQRAPGFDLDLYIDDLEIDTFINAKENQSATNSITFKFKVYEPYGFSFPHKLTQAMIASQKRNAAATNTTLDQVRSLNESFLMVVKFYGYDKNGKLVSSSDYPQPGVIKTDSQSVFERGFPIRFKDFKFKLENKMTVYSISAVQYAEQMAKGVNMGSIPAKMSVSGETVQDVLVGKTQEGSKKNVNGLADMLNQLEEDEMRKRKPGIEVKNRYVIQFDDADGIGDALLVPKDYYVKEKTPMSSIEGGGGSNERTAWKNRLGTVDKKTRTIEIPAGISVVQAIDNIISQSEYVKKMMIANDKEINETVTEGSEDTDVNSKPATLSWYSINTSAKRLDWDDKRKDYAHEITYQISKYEIPYIRSLYTSGSISYYGPHKRYNYWYTGKNTEVLSYEQDYNLLFTVEGQLSSDVETKNMQSAKTKLKAGQNVDSTTAKSGTNDIVNSVKSFLYSPDDLMKFKIKVLGDPDYLMPCIGTTSGGGENKWYGPDFSINPNAGQVFFEIIFQQGEDYDNKTGLLNPNGDIQFARYSSSMKVKPKGIVYMLTQVTSTFSKGKFEQTLKGVVPEFANGDTSTSPDSNDTAGASAKQSAGGGRSTAEFAATDPRRVDNAGGAGAGQGTAYAAALTQDELILKQHPLLLLV